MSLKVGFALPLLLICALTQCAQARYFNMSVPPDTVTVTAFKYFNNTFLMSTLRIPGTLANTYFPFINLSSHIISDFAPAYAHVFPAPVSIIRIPVCTLDNFLDCIFPSTNYKLTTYNANGNITSSFVFTGPAYRSCLPSVTLIAANATSLSLSFLNASDPKVFQRQVFLYTAKVGNVGEVRWNFFFVCLMDSSFLFCLFHLFHAFVFHVSRCMCACTQVCK